MVTPSGVLAEILIWSTTRPMWQRDALRRLVSAGSITARDIEELAQLCKVPTGLTGDVSSDVLSGNDLPTSSVGADSTTLVSLTHHRGANALAPNQTITFGSHLTIIYGQNAAGKSGYSRILKQACRSRHTEPIYGNLLSATAPPTFQATIVFRQGHEQAVPTEWTVESPPSAALAAVSVFDAGCAPVYLHDKTDVAFRPFGLDIFDRLAEICGQVRKQLESEKARLISSAPTLPTLPEGTIVRRLLDGLSPLTNPDTLRGLATLSENEDARLHELRSHQRDLQAADPKRRARDLNAKAERLDLLGRHVSGLFAIFRGSALSALQTASTALRTAEVSLAELRATTLTSDLLPGTGEEAWRKMWDATGEFSAVAYPHSSFPALESGARCPFCQQEIVAEAEARLRHLAEYATSPARSRLRETRTLHASAISKVTDAIIMREDIELAINELRSENPPLAQQVRGFLQATEQTRAGITAAMAQGVGFLAGLAKSPELELHAAASALRERAQQLLTERRAMPPEATAELSELEARLNLAEHVQLFISEIERKKHLAAYDQAIADTSTTAITRKSTELTKQLVTDQLRAGFQEELQSLEFNDLAVEVQAVGGQRGSLFHRLVFSNAPGVTLTHVLSEGESRTLSLASFLTELKTAASRSTIIFDDPVSSLDHVWRARLAKRLVAEAEITHDILFYRLLSDEAERRQIDCKEQYIRRDYQIGVCSEDLPSIAMKTGGRIGSLRRLWQEADTAFRRAPERYDSAAREIFRLLREAWEHAIPEILLGNVVQRYRHTIETQRVRYLHDITLEDCQAIDDGMTECSRWLHDQPAADATPIPRPDALKRRIDELDRWVDTIRARRR